jgi:MFS family permease
MANSPALRLNTIQWLTCFVAAMGFAFDIYVILVMPLILAPALSELANVRQGTPAYNEWVGRLFYIPAMAGGFFGLIGGYLADLLGRRRVLVWSILLYGAAAVGSGLASSVEELLIWRCAAFVGVCVEFVAAVAWLAELFPDAKQRESVLGYTQAFSSIGGLLAAGSYYLSVTYGNSFPEVMGGHSAWRYTMIMGLLPAIPLMIIRPFLPESEAWQKKKDAGTLKRPSFAQLFQPQYRKTTLVTTLMFACSYGVAFGAIQHLPRIVPGLPDVASLAPAVRQQIVSQVQSYQEIGGLVGRVILAFLAIRIASRRKLLRVFQVPGLLLVPFVFFYPAKDNLELLKIGIFFAGLLTVAQFSFWGNYLPRVYPTHLRGTGEGFAANVGGRMLGTGFAFVTTSLASNLSGAPHVQLAMAAAIVAAFVYTAGIVLSFFLPEPRGTDLPE